jgi:hypothetical protein
MDAARRGTLGRPARRGRHKGRRTRGTFVGLTAGVVVGPPRRCRGPHRITAFALPLPPAPEALIPFVDPGAVAVYVTYPIKERSGP